MHLINGANLNHCLDYMPRMLGFAWGIYIYNKQDDSRYDTPTQRWGWTKLVNKVKDVFTSGILGALTSGATSSYFLHSIDSLLPINPNNPWRDRSIKIIAWMSFFYLSHPARTRDPGYKAIQEAYNTSCTLHDVFANLDGSMTQLRCIHEIYSQPWTQNLRVSPGDFLLPLLCGLLWGIYRYRRQDTTLDPSQRSNWRVIRQLDEKLKSGKSGLVMSAALSSMGLFTIDQLAHPFFPKTALGKIFRFSPWVVYALLSLPVQPLYVKSISQIAFAIFHTFRFTFYFAQASLVHDEIKEIFCYKNILENPLNYLIPASVGVIGQLLFGGKDAPLKEKNSMLVEWMRKPYQRGGEKLIIISKVAYMSLCFIMVYQLSNMLEDRTQIQFPKSDQVRYDRLLHTWWNFLFSLGEHNRLFKTIFRTMNDNHNFYSLQYKQNGKHISFIDKLKVLQILHFTLKCRKELDQIIEKKYIPTAPPPPTEFDFSKSHILAILEILGKRWVM